MSMLILVRHGDAEAGGSDDQRALTQRGRDEIDRIGRWAARNGIRVARIGHSGKRRAEETAAILAAHLSTPAGGVLEGLRPNDDPRIVARLIEETEELLLVVSHMPLVGRLAALLVAGDADLDRFRIPTGSAIALVREGSVWSVGWMVTPETVG
ncbi:MAG TPA: phosphohistidine phosphatase SixA [Thermoanaerobaculia bacterium]|nr:phosphohistidine phosphatase SixA [Thermoanaerobaculia bacterium]